MKAHFIHFFSDSETRKYGDKRIHTVGDCKHNQSELLNTTRDCMICLYLVIRLFVLLQL